MGGLSTASCSRANSTKESIRTSLPSAVGERTLRPWSEVVEMTLELERAPQADGVANARLGTLKSSKSEAEQGSLAERLRAGGVQHEDMRDWLAQVDALGDLRLPAGVDLPATI